MPRKLGSWKSNWSSPNGVTPGYFRIQALKLAATRWTLHKRGFQVSMLKKLPPCTWDLSKSSFYFLRMFHFEHLGAQTTSDLDFGSNARQQNHLTLFAQRPMLRRQCLLSQCCVSHPVYQSTQKVETSWMIRFGKITWSSYHHDITYGVRFVISVGSTNGMSQRFFDHEASSCVDVKIVVESREPRGFPECWGFQFWQFLQRIRKGTCE